MIQTQESNEVQFLVRKQEQADEINSSHTNKRISEKIQFNESVTATTDTATAV